MCDRLYFVTRADLSEGRRAAQLIHAMDQWSLQFGPQQGTVIVYQVPNEESLLKMLPEGGQTVLWREPDLDNQATAFATDQGRMDLPLLGQRPPTPEPLSGGGVTPGGTRIGSPFMRG